MTRISEDQQGTIFYYLAFVIILIFWFILFYLDFHFLGTGQESSSLAGALPGESWCVYLLSGLSIFFLDKSGLKISKKSWYFISCLFQFYWKKSLSLLFFCFENIQKDFVPSWWKHPISMNICWFGLFFGAFSSSFHKSSYLSRSYLFAATRLVSLSSFPLPHWPSTSLKLQGWLAWYILIWPFFYFIQTFSQLWSGDMYSLDREHLPADRSWLQHIFHDLLPHQSELFLVQRSLWEQWFLVYRRFGQVLVYVWARLFCRLLHHPAVLCLHIPG